ncbi:hypothetical protein [Pantoea cypripedii]|uniref:HNH endonuclease n=1 Tax=Pantoea cypripedii TaxID=55209 RepID=A0A1X1EW48_PANCY|nr:hypothetical protein [Pantoea cypripedii]MBP2198155.1 hypothetical protein [Pantoea cypripedii]ORM93995.1 hypothetical protein HA50_11790 [Pantoea cypripedii]
MRDDTAFLEWCVRVNYFSEFNITFAVNRHLRAAVITVFFAGRTNDYDQFNIDIAALKHVKSPATKVDSLRIFLNKSEAALVKAAFISTPWQGKRLNRRSQVFEAALRGLTSPQRLVFNTWMEESYTRFRSSVSAPGFAKSLSSVVCPYCDKAFLDVGKQFYGELDHYLDKSTYSYYALNIYNFVPVCGICNRKKSKTKLQHFNPRDDSLDSVFHFYLSDPDKHNALLNYQITNVKIRQHYVQGKKSHLEELNETFALDDRYENMTAVVDYLAQLKRIYTREWMDELEATYGIEISREQLQQLLLGQFSFRNPATRLQPLTKLIDDLVRDLDVFNDIPVRNPIP